MTRIIQEDTLELEARRQYGAFHRRQAAAHGFSNSRLVRLRRRGIIRPSLPAVFCYTAAPSSHLQRCMVADLWAGSQSALTKQTAARLHGLDVRDVGRIQVVTTRHLRNPNAQIQVSRRPLLPGHHITMFGPLRVTSIERTLFELAWELDRESMDTAIDSAVFRGTTLESLWGTWMELHTCGRNGSVNFRENLERRVPGEAPPTNRNERKFLNLIERAGLPRPQCQVPIYAGAEFVARPDFMFPDHRLVVEVLSREWHQTITQRIADDARAARLDALGWRVVRVWWEELVNDPDGVVRRISSSLSVPAGALGAQ